MIKIWLPEFIIKKLGWQFIKFCFVGGTAALINFSLYYYLTDRLLVWYIYSAIVGFVVSAIFNFSANKFWTFGNQEVGLAALGKQVSKFGVVMVSGLVINILIIYLLTESIRLDYRLSWVIATGVVTFWSYGFNRLWTFRGSKNTLIKNS
jgi:putative flippase GtrA